MVRELNFEVNDEDADQLKADLESAVSSSTPLLWVTDRDGRNIGVSVDQLT